MVGDKISSASDAKPADSFSNYGRTSGQRVAPLWHTALLILYTLALLPQHFSLKGYRVFGIELQTKVVIYGINVAMQAASVFFLAVGVHACGRSLRGLIRSDKAQSRDLVDDVLAALAFCIVVIAVGFSLIVLLGSPRFAYQPSTTAPQTLLDLSMWVPLAISSGIVEELIFRGYLMQQFYYYCGSMELAVCLQAILFSIGHGYNQTPAGFIHKFLLGVLFGVLAWRRRSLHAAMISHSVLDLLAGLTSVLR